MLIVEMEYGTMIYPFLDESATIGQRASGGYLQVTKKTHAEIPGEVLVNCGFQRALSPEALQALKLAIDKAQELSLKER